MSTRRADHPLADPIVSKETTSMNRSHRNHPARRLRLVWAIATALFAAAVAPAAASAAGPAFKVTASIPDHVTPGKQIVIAYSAQNVGDEPFSGNVTVKYVFPAGVTPTEPQLFNPDPEQTNFVCGTVGQEVTCEFEAGGVQPGTQIRLKEIASVELSASGLLSGQIEVSGGGTGETVVKPFTFDTGTPPPFSIKTFDIDQKSASALPTTQAAATVGELTTLVEFPSEATALAGVFPAPAAPQESYRNAIAHVPPGFVGNPIATPERCTAAQLTQKLPEAPGIPKCPPDSQIGLVEIGVGDIVPLYNIQPPAGSPAEFGFFYQSVIITINARVRPSDDGIDLVARNVPNSIPLPNFEIIMWGVPGDPSHNSLRGACLNGGFGYNPAEGNCSITVPRRQFLRNPTSCTGQSLPWEIEVDTYQHPDAYVKRSTTTPALEGCASVPFDPSVSVASAEKAADTPSGLEFKLEMPQENGPDALSQADLRSATVTLPRGVSINPASADGLAACTDAQLQLGQEGPSQCPDAAKIGSVEVQTPLLEEPLAGSVFLRSQASSDPASGEMYRLAIELRSDERGLAIKLPGRLKVDPATGQLTTVFDDLPQLPFEQMDLQFKPGPRAPLTTPSTCGAYTTEAQLTSWSGRTVEQESTFQVNQSCIAPGFRPGFEAGAQNSTAGEFSPFTLRVTRDAGMPNVTSISATLPEGELAKLAGVPVCGDGPATTGACPAGSKIGSVIAAVGEGSAPLYLPQPGKNPTAVYLAGPYKGAPYSVVASVPAQSGPFDLGTVTVRSALRVDPVTTRVTVASDPLPQIFGGIPVSYRDVRVNVDRPKFTVTPTSCEPQTVNGTIGASDGATAAVSDRFQASDCAALGFKPNLSIKLGGETRRAGHPALTAVLQMPKGGANIARTSVALPHAEFLAQSHISTTCTRVQYAAGAGGGAGCPKGSVYGHARAFSPLLDRPLEGPVYLRSNGGERLLPDLVASLGGQIHVDLVGYVDSDKKTGGLRTTFAKVPDAPVSKFVLKMPGGKKSLLENSTNICRGKHRAIVKMDGQNGKIHDSRPLVRAKCGKGARRS